MTDFSNLLNKEQCAAATAEDGPILVLAAAGTGKTRTLVHRVAYLIEQGVPPDRIMLLTFTNRAAREMIERAEKVVGSAVSSIWSGTFHSICARLLRRYGMLIGYQPGFSIIDTEDQKKIVNEIIKANVKNPKEFPKKEVILRFISEAANEGKSVEFVAERAQTKFAGYTPEQIVSIAEKYVARKHELNVMDFDDLLVNGLELIKTQENVREMLQEHFLYVLVDEYQDTNGLQAEFTDILASKHRNILAVGDDFQCIYTWRGAQIENILGFAKRWEGCKVIKLEQNYRSVPSVLSVANVVVKDAPKQFEKHLRSTRRDNGEVPWLYSVYDGHAQGAEILRLINESRQLGYRYSDIAIIYRSHYQSIEVQMSLARQMIPFRITSGVGVFEQVHVKDVLSYLRLLVNPNDEISFMRFITLLPGVGEMSAKKLWEKNNKKFDPMDAKDVAIIGEKLSAKAKTKWSLLVKVFSKAREYFEDDLQGELVTSFVEGFYNDYAHEEWEESDAEDRLDDLIELASHISEAENGLEGFLQDVALLTNLDVKRNEPERDAVTLSTIHQAKGMEWSVVMVPWMSEGKFPSSKSLEEARGDEERRLFYVAVTRAKDRLFLFSPRIDRTSDGGFFPIEPSVFIREIPKELVSIRNVSSGFSPTQFSREKYSYSNKRNASWRR